MTPDSNTINWFEIPVSDFNRAKKFYETIIDGEMQEMPMSAFTMGFFPSTPGNGKLSGAIIKGDGYKPSADGTIVYLNCEPDLSATLNRVEKAGGKILVPKTEIAPEHGYYAFIMDTEGNKVGLHSQN